MNDVLHVFIYIIPLTILAIFLSKYIYKIYLGENVFLSKVIKPIENRIYKLLNVKVNEEMNSKKYFLSIIFFTIFSFAFLFLILIFQQFLPLNKENFKGINLSLAFNIVCSYITNTNWQSYLGENSLSYFSQMIGLTVQNFLSAGVGISVLFALIRGITSENKKSLGNFWVDLTKVTLYIFLPLSIIVSVILVANGVVQTFNSYKNIFMLETGENQVIPMRSCCKSNCNKTIRNKWRRIFWR